jgi:hypothetical protein
MVAFLRQIAFALDGDFPLHFVEWVLRGILKGGSLAKLRSTHSLSDATVSSLIIASASSRVA